MTTEQPQSSKSFEFAGANYVTAPVNVAWYKRAKQFVSRFEQYVNDETFDELAKIQDNATDIETFLTSSPPDAPVTSSTGLKYLAMMNAYNQKLANAKEIFMLETFTTYDAESMPVMKTNMSDLFEFYLVDGHMIDTNVTGSDAVMLLMEFAESVLNDFFFVVATSKNMLKTSNVILNILQQPTNMT